MAVTRSSSTVDIGSQQVVATSARSLLERQSHPDQVKTETTSELRQNAVETVTGRSTSTNIIKSLMPDGLTLNARAMAYTVNGLREDVVDALAEKNRVRTQQEIPTADYVVRNSFKVGAKLLIKIEPTRKDTRLPDNQPNLVFNKFSLQAIAESDAERYQLHETFEDEVLYMFGRRPRVWTMQGIVLNGRRAPEMTDEQIAAATTDADLYARLEEKRQKRDMDWANRLLMDWENYYRGSRAVEARSRTFLAYDDSVIEATLLELVMARNAQVPTAVNATLTFVVHRRAFMGQEYVEGVSPANLKDLVARTNSGTAFEDRVDPSDLVPADIELAEVNRQQALAQEDLRLAQIEARGRLEEENRVRRDLARAQADQTSAQNDIDQAVSDREQAEKEALQAVPDSAEQLAAEQRVAVATALEAEAQSRLLEARAREQSLESSLDTEATNTAVSEEEDAQTRVDTISAYSQQMSTEEGQQEIEDQVLSVFGDDYTNIRNVVYDSDTGIVTFDADGIAGGTVTVREMLT